MFTHFFRASNAIERSIPGTGLGLSIVRTIIANHGGTLDVDSCEGCGTAITVRLPLLAWMAPLASRATAAKGGAVTPP
jgi:signal transduction histidine kinase